jgi:hypothetical protein
MGSITAQVIGHSGVVVPWVTDTSRTDRLARSLKRLRFGLIQQKYLASVPDRYQGVKASMFP